MEMHSGGGHFKPLLEYLTCFKSPIRIPLSLKQLEGLLQQPKTQRHLVVGAAVRSNTKIYSPAFCQWCRLITTSVKVQSCSLKIHTFYSSNYIKPISAFSGTFLSGRLVNMVFAFQMTPSHVLLHASPINFQVSVTQQNPSVFENGNQFLNLLEKHGGMFIKVSGLFQRVTAEAFEPIKPLIAFCLQLKWCAWIAVYCSFISFANSRSSEDTKQMMSSFM